MFHQESLRSGHAIPRGTMLIHIATVAVEPGIRIATCPDHIFGVALLEIILVKTTGRVHQPVFQTGALLLRSRLTRRVSHRVSRLLPSLLTIPLPSLRDLFSGPTPN